MYRFKQHPLIRTLLCLNNHSFSEPLSFSAAIPKCYLFLQLKHPITIHSFSTTTSSASDQQSFTVSYLTNNCGFSPQDALKVCKRVRFETPRKPDSVLAFFTNYGFSKTQIHSIMCGAPELLMCDVDKRVLPKFEFLASKGASRSDILFMVIRNPNFLRRGLESIIHMYELLRMFCPSDEKVIASIIGLPSLVGDYRVARNVKMLLDEGLANSNIYHLFRTRPSILCSKDLSQTVEELKQLGFNPNRLNFSVALLAKRVVNKTKWDAKVNAIKTWGYSEQEISDTFRKHPKLMLRSEQKLNAVMKFWISQLGWDPSVLLRKPVIFGFSLEKRLIPRASVIQYLLSEGLMKKNASLATPLDLTEKLFLQRFVTCFKEKKTSQLLLKLYQRGC